MRNKTTERKSVQSRKILTVIMTALVVSMLSACGSSNTSVNTNASGNSDISGNSTSSGSGKFESTTEESKTDVYVTPTVENGETSGGCNPTYIDYKNTYGKLTVSTADLDTYADRFTSWGGPVE